MNNSFGLGAFGCAGLVELRAGFKQAVAQTVDCIAPAHVDHTDVCSAQPSGKFWQQRDPARGIVLDERNRFRIGTFGVGDEIVQLYERCTVGDDARDLGRMRMGEEFARSEQILCLLGSAGVACPGCEEAGISRIVSEVEVKLPLFNRHLQADPAREKRRQGRQFVCARTQVSVEGRTVNVVNDAIAVIVLPIEWLGRVDRRRLGKNVVSNPDSQTTTATGRAPASSFASGSRAGQMSTGRLAGASSQALKTVVSSVRQEGSCSATTRHPARYMPSRKSIPRLPWRGPPS